jgi:hypothetical protein
MKRLEMGKDELHKNKNVMESFRRIRSVRKSGS